jgi:membrane-associated phospholipid phosphatase
VPERRGRQPRGRAQLLSALGECDRRLLVIARTSGHSPAAERAVARFSRLGEHAAIWLAIGSVGSLRRDGSERAWRLATGAVACGYLLNTAIKFTIRRPRPALPGLPPLTSTTSGLSFPSAHTTTSVLAASLYSELSLPAGPLHALAGAFAYSRIYLGVHYPSDLLGGALLGGAMAALFRPFLAAAHAGKGERG